MIVLTHWTMHAGPMPASVTDDPGPEIERGTGEIVAPQTMYAGPPPDTAGWTPATDQAWVRFIPAPDHGAN